MKKYNVYYVSFIYIIFTSFTTIFQVYMPMYAERIFGGNIFIVAILISIPIVIACFSYKITINFIMVFNYHLPKVISIIALISGTLYVVCYFSGNLHKLFLFLAVIAGAICSSFIYWIREDMAIRSGKFELVRIINCIFIFVFLYLISKITNLDALTPVIIACVWIIICIFYYNPCKLITVTQNQQDYIQPTIADTHKFLPFCILISANTPLNLYGAIEWARFGYTTTEIGQFWSLGLFSEVLFFLSAKYLPSEFICILIYLCLAIIRWTLFIVTQDAKFIAIGQLLHGATFALPLILSTNSIAHLKHKKLIIAKFLSIQYTIQAIGIISTGILFKYFSVSPWVCAIFLSLSGCCLWFNTNLPLTKIK